MKANITYIKSIFDEEPKTITVYGKSREAIYGICDSLGSSFVLTNVYISDDKSSEETKKD